MFKSFILYSKFLSTYVITAETNEARRKELI